MKSIFASPYVQKIAIFTFLGALKLDFENALPFVSAEIAKNQMFEIQASSNLFHVKS